MSVVYFSKPDLILSDMIRAWSGIGQVATTVGETLRRQPKAVQFAEPDPKPFCCP